MSFSIGWGLEKGILLINAPKSSRPCSTATVYQASPSVAPTLHMAVCGGDWADGVGLGLPTDVKTIYHQRPSTGADNITPPPNTQPTQQPTGTNASGSGNSSLDNESSSKNKKVPIILGAVFGSLGGVGFAAMAYYFGRRRAIKKNMPQLSPSNEVQDKTPELGPSSLRHPELDSTQLVEAPQPEFYSSQVAQAASPELDSSQQIWHPQNALGGWQDASELSGQARAHELSAHPCPYEKSGSLR